MWSYLLKECGICVVCEELKQNHFVHFLYKQTRRSITAKLPALLIHVIFVGLSTDKQGKLQLGVFVKLVVHIAVGCALLEASIRSMA